MLLENTGNKHYLFFLESRNPSFRGYAFRVSIKDFIEKVLPCRNPSFRGYAFREVKSFMLSPNHWGRNPSFRGYAFRVKKKGYASDKNYVSQSFLSRICF